MYRFSYYCDVVSKALPGEALIAYKSGTLDTFFVSGVPPCRAIRPSDWELMEQWGLYPLSDFLFLRPKDAIEKTRNMGVDLGIYKLESKIDDNISRLTIHTW